jgi:hypothetical protein
MDFSQEEHFYPLWCNIGGLIDYELVPSARLEEPRDCTLMSPNCDSFAT